MLGWGLPGGLGLARKCPGGIQRVETGGNLAKDDDASGHGRILVTA
jgi:hypothetical protein